MRFSAIESSQDSYSIRRRDGDVFYSRGARPIRFLSTVTTTGLCTPTSSRRPFEPTQQLLYRRVPFREPLHRVEVRTADYHASEFVMLVAVLGARFASRGIRTLRVEATQPVAPGEFRYRIALHAWR
jgi:hypothetical protein